LHSILSSLRKASRHCQIYGPTPRAVTELKVSFLFPRARAGISPFGIKWSGERNAFLHRDLPRDNPTLLLRLFFLAVTELTPAISKEADRDA
jgi:hypothetical protein